MNKKFVGSLLSVGKLKSLKRTGWVREGMPDPESVAEHTFRVCFLVVTLAEELEIDATRLLKMGLLHDVEEAVTQDPVTQRGAKNVGAHDHEQEGVITKDILKGFGNTDELYEFWKAHLPEKGPDATREANILYQIGKIATAWQALEYEISGQDPRKMDEWWENAKAHVDEPILVDVLKSLEEARLK